MPGSLIVIVIPNVGVPHLGATGFLQRIVTGVATHVLGVSCQGSFRIKEFPFNR
jgi:hypothetical protein